MILQSFSGKGLSRRNPELNDPTAAQNGIPYTHRMRSVALQAMTATDFGSSILKHSVEASWPITWHDGPRTIPGMVSYTSNIP